MRRLITTVKEIRAKYMPSDELWLTYMPSIKASDRSSVEVVHEKSGKRKAVFTYWCNE